MPATMPYLTPMEERVLRAMHECYEHHADFYWRCDDIVHAGKELFGPGWGGESPGKLAYPVVNRFLGRLEKKGLVKRYKTSFHATACFWSTTTAAHPFNPYL